MKLLQLKLANTGNVGSFTGLAAAFGPLPDRQGDIIEVTAFDATLAEWKARGFNIPLLFQHNQDRPIGSITSATATAEGLTCNGQLALETADAQDAFALARVGALSMSIGYTIRPGGLKLAGDVRHLLAIDLHEISLVSVPANPAARIAGIKRATDCSTIRQFEALARDALGLSSRDAKAVAAKSWPIVSRRDGGHGRRDGAPDATVHKALAILAASTPIR